MDWKEIATQFGLPGFLIAVIGYVSLTLGKLWIASNERIQMDRTKVEDKRADAMVAALTMLGSKIDAHHTADIQSHQQLATGIAEIKGKLDEALIERTPVEGVPRVPAPGTGYYAPQRPKTQGGGR